MASEASYLQSQAFGKSWLPPRGLSMAFLGLAWNILRVGVAHDISGRSYQVPRELFFFFKFEGYSMSDALHFRGYRGYPKLRDELPSLICFMHFYLQLHHCFLIRVWQISSLQASSIMRRSQKPLSRRPGISPCCACPMIHLLVVVSM